MGNAMITIFTNHARISKTQHKTAMKRIYCPQCLACMTVFDCKYGFRRIKRSPTGNPKFLLGLQLHNLGMYNLSTQEMHVILGNLVGNKCFVRVWVYASDWNLTHSLYCQILIRKLL